MALPAANILSAVSGHLRDMVAALVSGKPQVRIGPPADAEPKNPNSEPLINLFLYRIEPSGFYPDTTINDPFMVRIHCLVTAYSSPTNETGSDGSDVMVSAGEINLRLLGSLIQVFHENPVREIVFKRTNPITSSEEEIRTSLQIIFKPLSSEEINQIWATQNDTAYRSSLAYELALVPIVPWTEKSIPAAVGSAEISVSPFATTSAIGNASGVGGAPPLSPILAAESTMIEDAKDNPPELPPELVFSGQPAGSRRVVKGWEDSSNGDDFVTETDLIEIVFTPYSGLGDHVLAVFERTGSDWKQIRNSVVADPAAGEVSTVIGFVVIRKPGEWMFYVESTLSVIAGSPETLRSNIIELQVVRVSEPVAAGGSP